MPPNTATSLTTALKAACDALPLVAILRGLTPPEAEGIGATLYAAGFRLIEVPLNSPDPLRSIEWLRRSLPADALVGAGTVLHVDDIARLCEVGAELIVMPHADVHVIAAAKAAGRLCIPGVATPSEAFAALAAGADALKLFPAELVTPVVVKAMRAVLPADVGLFPVGGITPSGMAAYRRAGARGFGLGSALYKPGQSRVAVAQQAAEFVQAWRDSTQG